MMKTKTTIVLLVVLVITTVSCEASQMVLEQTTVVPKQKSDVVFVRQGWIYLLSKAQTSPRKIIEGEHPTLNTAGSEIAYTKPQDQTSAEPAETTLMLFDTKLGKSREMLRIKGYVSNLRFAPDGEFVLFVLRTPEGITKLEIFNTAGKESFTVNRSDKEINDIFSPVWAVDGKSVYFHDMTNLFHVSFDGQILAKTPLTTFTGDKDSITSSDRYIPSPKDVNSILFTQLVPGTPIFDKAFGEPNTALFLYDLTGQSKRRITEENLFAVNPHWSSDGQTIYFTGYYDRNGTEAYPFKVFEIKSDGTGLKELASGETN